METDPGLWKQVSGYLWGVLVPVGAYIWKRQDKRIDDLQADTDSKASEKEMDTQRGNIGKLFDKLEEHAQQDQTLHNAMMTELGKIGQSVARIEGRLDR